MIYIYDKRRTNVLHNPWGCTVPGDPHGLVGQLLQHMPHFTRNAAVFCFFLFMHAPIQGPCLGPTQLQAARSAEVGIYGDQDDFALVLLEDADGETIQLTEDSG